MQCVNSFLSHHISRKGASLLPLKAAENTNLSITAPSSRRDGMIPQLYPKKSKALEQDLTNCPAFNQISPGLRNALS